MSTNPYLVARLSSQYQADMEAQARNHRLRCEAARAPAPAQPKVPSRAPRRWRWEYLTRRAFR